MYIALVFCMFQALAFYFQVVSRKQAEMVAKKVGMTTEKVQGIFDLNKHFARCFRIFPYFLALKVYY